MMQLLAETTQSVPASVVGSIVAAVVGALGGGYWGHKKQTEAAANYVTREEFNRAVKEVRDAVLESERITQTKLDQITKVLIDMNGKISQP